MPIEPLAIGVCSWSLQVTSVPELKRLMDGLGVDVVQIACGDPHHASWDEGDAMPRAARAAGFRMTGTMLGFPGEDYTTPETIQKTGGFGDPTTRPERLDRFRWALDRTAALGLTDIMLHAGFLPEPGTPDRKPFLDTLATLSRLAAEKAMTVAFETGQETADLLRGTLDELQLPEPQGQFRPGQHDPLRQGQSAAGGRDPRPGHPQRPRQGRQTYPRPRHLGRGGAARRGPGQHPRIRAAACRTSATAGRYASNARSATRRSASPTSPTGFAICANVSLDRRLRLSGSPLRAAKPQAANPKEDLSMTATTTPKATRAVKPPKVKDQPMFIGGKWVDSVCGKTFPTINPATGETICQVAEGDKADVDLRRQGRPQGVRRRPLVEDERLRTRPAAPPPRRPDRAAQGRTRRPRNARQRQAATPTRWPPTCRSRSSATATTPAGRTRFTARRSRSMARTFATRATSRSASSARSSRGISRC